MSHLSLRDGFWSIAWSALVLVCITSSCKVYNSDLMTTTPDSANSAIGTSDSSDAPSSHSDAGEVIDSDTPDDEPLDADSEDVVVPDSASDSETDAMNDTEDAACDLIADSDEIDCCPKDPNKTEPGECGCGFADELDGCLGLVAALRHRYSFEGSGTTATDSKGDEDGTVINTSLSGDGNLELDGRDDYVELPDGLISELEDATFESWVTWGNNISPWQRIFDFGNSSNDTYFFLTPMNFGFSGVTSLVYTNSGKSFEVKLFAAQQLPTNEMIHVVAVVDDTNDKLRLYIDGEPDPSDGIDFRESLSSIIDTNNWLGRSQYSVDSYLEATLHEFRIYDAALEASQIQVSCSAGPDADFF